MVSVLGAAAAAGTVAGASVYGGATLFQYNRKNFLYDRDSRQEAEYQIMEFRIKQAGLWREDIKDIIGLTAVKMDTYLIISAVQLGFTVTAFCEGRIAPGTPTFLIGCHTISIASSFMFTLMAVWLTMHASVAARSYKVRLLTDFVRLPVPSWAQLEGSRTYGSQFEKISAKQMFRVPFAMGVQEARLQSAEPVRRDREASARECTSDMDGARAIADAPESAGTELSGEPISAATARRHTDGVLGAATADPWGLERRGTDIYELDGSVRSDPNMLRHIQLVRKAIRYWQTYDAFARVSLSVGMNQLIMALSYYILGYVLVSNNSLVGAWLGVLIFMGIAVALIQLDMSLTQIEHLIAVPLACGGPLVTCVAVMEWTERTPESVHFARVLMPFVYAIHATWMLFILYSTKVGEQKGGALLPTGFFSVLYIDIFGWINRSIAPYRRQFWDHMHPKVPPLATDDEWSAGSGPAMQNVAFDDGHPVSSRPEDSVGAAQPTRIGDVTVQDLHPSSFFPHVGRSHDAGDEESGIPETADASAADYGVTPWRVFRRAATLAALVWWIAGILVAVQMVQEHFAEVQPLLREMAHRNGDEWSLMQYATRQLSGGEVITTDWPHDSVLPYGLACGGGAAPTVVASSRYSLFTAKLGSDGSNRKLRFQPTVPCEGEAAGEIFQDVALRCREGVGADGAGASCQALVLYEQGRRLATCDLAATRNVTQHQPSDDLAGAWLTSESSVEAADAELGEGWDPMSAEPVAGLVGPFDEEITSLAFDKNCRGRRGGECAYVATSGQRIVEVQTAPGRGVSGVLEWLPHRVLLGHFEDSGLSGGSLHLLNDQYLAVLQRNAQIMDVLDLHQGGAIIGQWALPQSQEWVAMCATGGNIYLLPTGPSPQMLRFPVPEVLQAEDPPARATPDGAPRSIVEMPTSSVFRKGPLVAAALSVHIPSTREA